uniref:Uncharacterized protein n=1 Tax=Macrostomum lignano TaxID=282301 RepID=A0A1I8FL81_9PLAT
RPTAVYENEPAPLPDWLLCGTASPLPTEHRTSWSSSTPNGSRRSSCSKSQQQKTCGETPIRLDEGEGGIYENEPVQLPDVVRPDPAAAEDYRLYAEGKCATLAKQRFMSEAAQKAARPSDAWCWSLPTIAVCTRTVRRSATMSPAGRPGRGSRLRSGRRLQPRSHAWQQAAASSSPRRPSPSLITVSVIPCPAALDFDPQTENSSARVPPALGAEPKAPVALEMGEGGVYENQPQKLLPDVVQYQAGGGGELGDIRGTASAAKRQLLLRQREAEEAARAGRPGMVNFAAAAAAAAAKSLLAASHAAPPLQPPLPSHCSDPPCRLTSGPSSQSHSGVFENDPQQRGLLTSSGAAAPMIDEAYIYFGS